ncbi:MAG: hypothetical protein IMZ57_02270 [Acidobacteria bacterium]|nr:hypothetical protein [Acidobacteriota bacterium]
MKPYFADVSRALEVLTREKEGWDEQLCRVLCVVKRMGIAKMEADGLPAEAAAAILYAGYCDARAAMDAEDRPAKPEPTLTSAWWNIKTWKWAGEPWCYCIADADNMVIRGATGFNSEDAAVKAAQDWLHEHERPVETVAYLAKKPESDT